MVGTNTKYLIFKDGVQVDETSLRGLAFIKLDTANFDGRGDLVRFVDGDDPVIHGYFTFNKTDGGWDHGLNINKVQDSDQDRSMSMI